MTTSNPRQVQTAYNGDLGSLEPDHFKRLALGAWHGPFFNPAVQMVEERYAPINWRRLDIESIGHRIGGKAFTPRPTDDGYVWFGGIAFRLTQEGQCGMLLLPRGAGVNESERGTARAMREDGSVSILVREFCIDLDAPTPAEFPTPGKTTARSVALHIWSDERDAVVNPADADGFLQTFAGILELEAPKLAA